MELLDTCFTVLNKEKNPIIYRTSQLDENVLFFEITNTMDKVLVLNGGTPANKLSLKQVKSRNGDLRQVRTLHSSEMKASTFNFNFQSLLDAENVKNMQIKLPENWAAVFIPASDDMKASWSLAPIQGEIRIEPTKSVRFELTHFTALNLNPAYFELVYQDVPEYDPPMFPYTNYLGVENQVDPVKKAFPFKIGYTNVVHPMNGQTSRSTLTLGEETLLADIPIPIFITYDLKAQIENGFDLTLSNPTDKPVVPPAQTISGELGDANQPQMYISFLFGDNRTDITTQTLADNQITIDVSSSVWSSNSHTAGTAYWLFYPKSPEILKAHETVRFPVHKIITPLDVPAGDISFMYIQINNIPGYNDYSDSINLEKLNAVASIVKFEAAPTTINLGDAVKLTWETELANRVTIDYEDRDGLKIRLDSDKGEIKLSQSNFEPKPNPTLERTDFVLTAYDKKNAVTKQVTITVNQVKANIKTFTASMYLVPKGGNTELTWETENANKVTLEVKGNSHDVGKYGKETEKVDATQLFKLFAYSYGTKFPVPTTALIRAYSYESDDRITQPYVKDAMQTWPSILVNSNKTQLAVLNAGTSKITTYNLKESTKITEYTGAAMALGKDGGKLFIYDNRPEAFGVRILDVNSGSLSPQVDAGPVYLMLSSPDMSRLYCASTHNCTTVTVLNINVGANTLSKLRTIELKLDSSVGQSPRAMVFNKDASKLYVADYDTQNVCVIITADVGNMGKNPISKFIPLSSSEPHSFAYHADKNVLYVACEGSNYVEIIDTNTDTLLGKVQVGNRPSTLLLSPNKSRLYVSNFGSNTVSVIKTEDNSVEKTLTVGRGPITMALNGDNNVFFVGNYCDKTLSVVDLLTNEVLPQTLTTGGDSGNPFDMAVFNNDNGYANVYTSKEIFPQRIDCANPGKANLNVSVYSIQKPSI